MKISRVVVSAPGKVILHGEHAVVYGKAAVAASIGLRTKVTLQKTNDDTICLELRELNHKLTWNVKDIEKEVVTETPQVSHRTPKSATSGMLKIIDGLIDHALNETSILNKIGDDVNSLEYSIPPAKLARITEELNPENVRAVCDAARVFLFLVTSILHENGRLQSLNIQVTSTIPIGAGLGSSAAFSISLVTAMLVASQAIDTTSDSQAEETRLDREGNNFLSSKSLELVCQWAFEAEKLMHGRPSGIDNSIGTYGAALLFQNGKMTPLHSMPTLKILIVDTQVARSTSVMVSGLRNRCDQFPTIYQPLFDAVDGISHEAIKVFKKLADIQKKHTYCQEMDNCFAQLEMLMDMNQKLLALLGVSHPVLDKLCDKTLELGPHSKLTGAGGGGCAFTLLRPDTSDDVIQRVTKVLSDSLGCRVWQTSLGSSGVTVEEWDS